MESDSIGPLHFSYLTVAAAARGFPAHDWVLVAALVLTLFVAALSAAAETALTSVSRIKIRNQAEEGDPRAKRIERLLQSPQTFLTTILVVSNIAVITSSTLATIIAVDLNFTGAEVVSTVVLSLIVLIFAEITPKSAAVQSPERWSKVLVGPVDVCTRILYPLVRFLIWITSFLIRLIGGSNVRHGPFVTEDELRLLVEVGGEEGVLEEEEREMIDNVFELADTSVREVMVPRVDMVTVEADDAIDDALQVVLQGGQSRVPVYDGSIDNIIGVLYAKDLLRVLATGRRPATVRQLPLRQGYFVPESKRLDDLMREMQKQRVHMAIVVDEYGGVAGLVTIEDLVEEIIGDIQDEYDIQEVLFEQVSANEFVVNAKVTLDEFAEITNRELPPDGYETLGGFVYAQLDKIPTVGDEVRYTDMGFTVLGTKGRRITRVKVLLGLPAEAAAGTDDEDRQALRAVDGGSRDRPPQA